MKVQQCWLLLVRMSDKFVVIEGLAAADVLDHWRFLVLFSVRMIMRWLDVEIPTAWVRPADNSSKDTAEESTAMSSSCGLSGNLMRERRCI